MDCQNCGSSKIENFCPNCGEKRFSPHSLTLRHLSEETLEGFSHFDNKFFGTLKTLLFKPAELSLAYCNGITVKYMKPIGFFLITNLIFFIFSLNNPFNLPLHNYLNYTPFTNYHTKEMVIKKMIDSKLTENELKEVFNEKMKTNSKGFLILFIPFLATAMALIFLLNKRKYGEHVILATHFMCFVLWLLLLQSYIVKALAILMELINLPLDDRAADTIISTIDLIIALCYLYIGIRKFYKTNIVLAMLGSLAIGIIFAEAIQGYRMILFFKILNLS